MESNWKRIWIHEIVNDSTLELLLHDNTKDGKMILKTKSCLYSRGLSRDKIIELMDSINKNIPESVGVKK